MAFPVAARLAISTQRYAPGQGWSALSREAHGDRRRPSEERKVKTGPLPRGIRLDRTLGLLSGTPTRPGRYRVTLEATDALKVTSKTTLLIEVLA